MFQIDNPTAVSTRPAPAAVGVPGWATAGNPAEGLQPTALDADFVNGQAAELLSILEAAGVAPDKTQVDQVLTSIQTLTLKWLGGGVLKGVNFIGNSRTLDATYGGFLNVLEATPVITLPLADTYARGAPLDFLCHAGGAVIARQGQDTLLLGEGSANSYTCSNSDKIRFVSDGGGTWILAQESNLFAPNFRSGATGQTAQRNVTGRQLATLDYARSLGRNFSAKSYYNGNIPGAMPLTDLGRYVVLAGSASPFALPNAGLIGGDAFHIAALDAPKTITAGSGFTFDVPGTGTGLNTLTIPAHWCCAGSWGAGSVWDVSYFGPISGVDKLQPIASFTSSGPSIDWIWSAGQYDEVLLEYTNATAPLNNGTSFSVFIYPLAGGVEVTPLAGSVIGGSAEIGDGFVRLNRLNDPLYVTFESGSGTTNGVLPTTPQLVGNAGAGDAVGVLRGTIPITGLRIRAAYQGATQPLTTINVLQKAR